MRNQFGGHATQTSAPQGGDADGGSPDQSAAAQQAGAAEGHEGGES